MSNTTNLVVLEKHEITNKQLDKKVSNIVKALQTIEAGTWKYAVNVHQIITKELWQDDFESVDDFALYLGVTKSYLYKLCSAVDFASNYNVMDKYSVSKCYLLSTIKNYDEFTEWAKANKIDVTKLSKHQLEDTIKAYNNRNANAVREDKQQEETEEDYIDVKIKKHLYRIPLKVLNKYLVED